MKLGPGLAIAEDGEGLATGLAGPNAFPMSNLECVSDGVFFGEGVAELNEF